MVWHHTQRKEVWRVSNPAENFCRIAHDYNAAVVLTSSKEILGGRLQPTLILVRLSPKDGQNKRPPLQAQGSKDVIFRLHRTAAFDQTRLTPARNYQHFT